MEKIDGKGRTLGEIFSKSFFFRIPDYQRPFSWDEDNFGDLVGDVLSANQEQDYFLGTIVLHHQEDKQIYDVVDGQQRLTCLMILLACLRDMVQDPAYKRDFQEKILQPENVLDSIPEKARLEVKDRGIFKEMVLTENGTLTVRDSNGMPEPERRYVIAQDIFTKKLKALDEQALQKLGQFISKRCVVIMLAAGGFADAFRLFTVVNDRGKQLRRIDILKALNVAPGIMASDTIRARVVQDWETYEKNLGELEFEGIFHLVRLIILKDKPQADLLTEFEERIFTPGKVVKGEAFFDLMFSYAKLFTTIFMDKDFLVAGEIEVNKYRALIRAMDSEFKASEWKACILAYASKFNSESFLKFLFRLEKVYLADWVKGVRKDERFANYAKILGSIEGARKADDVIASITYDEAAIKEAAGRADVYSVGYGKYFLLRLELQALEYEVPKELVAKSVEHVLPQDPEPSGYWASNHDLLKIKEYVHSIGNLVLLSKSKNSSAKNYDFEKKKEKYLSSRVSDFPRSVQVTACKSWTRQDIESRTKDAVEKILLDF